jgi:hypothetical protein
MTAEEIFNEVIKSSELKDIFHIPQEVLDHLDYNQTSDYPVIEIIKTIIRGEKNHTDSSAIFKNIQNHIM